MNAVDTTFLNCFSQYFGGAIYCKNNVDILNCSFSGNSGDFDGNGGGGAIYSSGNLPVRYSNFTDNSAGCAGDAIYSTNNLNLIDCNFLDCHATQ